MSDDRQERIRQRAHAIWEREGRPQGSHQQHWDAASAEIDAEDASTDFAKATAAAGSGAAATPSPDTEKFAGAGPAIAEHSKDAKSPKSGRQRGAYVKK